MKLPTLSLIAAAILGLSLWATMAKDACATGTIAAQTCDTEVWRSMEARARLETEREIMQNQNLIFKADSILNYVCFDKLAGHAAANVGSLFTHTSYFGSVVIPWGSPNGMDNAINRTVIDSMRTYITSNFGHAYLGHRATEYMSAGGTTPTGGSNATPPTPQNANQSTTYSCGEMAKVWATAKCANFLHTNNLAGSDGFYPFINLQAGPGGGTAVAGYETVNDARRYPTACGGTPINGSTWLETYRLSRNEIGFGNPNQLYQFGQPLQRNFNDVRQKLEPATCGSPIRTGVTVILGPGASSSGTYQDGICTNPGCTYNRNGTCRATSGGGTPPAPVPGNPS